MLSDFAQERQAMPAASTYYKTGDWRKRSINDSAGHPLPPYATIAADIKRDEMIVACKVGWKLSLR